MIMDICTVFGYMKFKFKICKKRGTSPFFQGDGGRPPFSRPPGDVPLFPSPGHPESQQYFLFTKKLTSLKHIASLDK